jgi:hypothetical protein
MSLVSEALRKARQEASRREAEKRGTLIPAVIVRAGEGSRPGLPLVVGAALLAAVAGGGLVAWWTVRTPRTEGAAATRNGMDTRPPAASGATLGTISRSPLAARSSASPLRGGGAPAAVAPAGATPSVRPEAGAPPPLTPTAEGPAAKVGAVQSAQEVAGSPGRGVASSRLSQEMRGSHGERSFVIDAPLGYATLHLDYLVYKPGAPFASVNGKKVVTGGLVDGFRVDEITPDAVRLSDAHGPVILRVH